MINKLGCYLHAKQIPTPFCNERPANSPVSLLVIHCISLPEGHYGGEAIEKLFTGCLDCAADPRFADLKGLEVSAHCVIRRTGRVDQYVPFDKRAWHAGRSSFNGVVECNDYAIGIELEGTDQTAFTEAQYQSLAALTRQIQQHYPAINKQRIVAHSDIAPGRKTDPGSEFDWLYYFNLLSDGY